MRHLKELININIAGCEPLITPKAIKEEMPDTERAIENALAARKTIQDILDQKDCRLFFVVGPCSIHDVKAAREYAERLKVLADKVNDQIFIVMRVYFEKPRTTVGWKGLINDPCLDDSFQIEQGIRFARRLLLELNELGLPTATEALDPIIPQYIGELIAWSAIGARTTESQTHREMSSGLSMPVGFKNGTDGSIETALNAMESSLSPHHFLGIDQNGKIAKFSTRGNPYGHIVLRGGTSGPNYDPASIKACEAALEAKGLKRRIVVDCSHANSNKDCRRQPEVLAAVIEQLRAGNHSLCGVMIESFLHEGNQKLTKDIKELKHGVSITDPCVGWEMTEQMILSAHRVLTLSTK